MNTKDTGFLGENLAEAFIIKMGWTFIARNWRYKHLEIDLLFSNQDTLHIIEVKTRTQLNFGFPEQFINKQKMQYLKNVGAIYQYQHPQWKQVQFDVVAIHLSTHDKWVIDFFEDVYF
jgi:putative endonuclease